MHLSAVPRRERRLSCCFFYARRQGKLKQKMFNLSRQKSVSLKHFRLFPYISGQNMKTPDYIIQKDVTSYYDVKGIYTFHAGYSTSNIQRKKKYNTNVQLTAYSACLLLSTAITALFAALPGPFSAITTICSNGTYSRLFQALKLRLSWILTFKKLCF